MYGWFPVYLYWISPNKKLFFVYTGTWMLPPTASVLCLNRSSVKIKYLEQPPEKLHNVCHNIGTQSTVSLLRQCHLPILSYTSLGYPALPGMIQNRYLKEFNFCFIEFLPKRTPPDPLLRPLDPGGQGIGCPTSSNSYQGHIIQL